MKNYEKYADEIKRCDGLNFCRDFVKPYILKSRDCANTSCDQCKMLQIIWLMEEYEEPETDWSQVKVDTPILVRQGEKGQWLERHFAKYENGEVYAWVDGQTSWTGADEIKWKYSKLAEDEKECNNPEVDWSKVEVDTAIYVKASKYGNWFKRHFAEYKNGKIYTWGNGLTSHDTSRMMEWEYAKLAENEEAK